MHNKDSKITIMWDTPVNTSQLRYVEMNEYFLGYRKYNSEIPSFLVNRPRILIFTAKDIEGQHSAMISPKEQLKARVKVRMVAGINRVLEIL